jgi:hypothetical protein
MVTRVRGNRERTASKHSQIPAVNASVRVVYKIFMITAKVDPQKPTLPVWILICVTREGDCIEIF